MTNERKHKNAIIPETANLKDAMLSLKKTGLGLAIVVDMENKVVGVISDGDIRKKLINTENVHTLVTSCMSKNFVHLPEGVGRERVLKVLDTKIRAVPILDRDGRLVDIARNRYTAPSSSVVSRSRTPARVSLAGGGTDFTSFFMDHGGAGLSCTIAKYSHAILKKRFDKRVSIYSHDYMQQIEADNADSLVYDGTLDLIKAGIKLLKPDFGFNLEIGSDFPPASGLGGSASLLASVIGCFNEFRSHRLDRYAIAEYAFEAERIELQIAGGWQDQYSTVFGGFNYLQFGRQHNVVTPLRLESPYLNELEERFMLCHTGESHLGASIQNNNHGRIKNSHQKNDYGMQLKEITSGMKRTLLRGEFDTFSGLLDQTWKIKKDKNPNVTTPILDQYYDTAVQAGAAGGRLLGTGGGGYFLFVVPPFKRYAVVKALKNIGLRPESVIFDHKGMQSWRI